MVERLLFVAWDLFRCVLVLAGNVGKGLLDGLSITRLVGFCARAF